MIKVVREPSYDLSAIETILTSGSHSAFNHQKPPSKSIRPAFKPVLSPDDQPSDDASPDVRSAGPSHRKLSHLRLLTDKPHGHKAEFEFLLYVSFMDGGNDGKRVYNNISLLPPNNYDNP